MAPGAGATDGPPHPGVLRADRWPRRHHVPTDDGHRLPRATQHAGWLKSWPQNGSPHCPHAPRRLAVPQRTQHPTRLRPRPRKGHSLRRAVGVHGAQPRRLPHGAL
eukprot:scaffold1203_cov74-Phaeocystis_antarctica.AAC.5